MSKLFQAFVLNEPAVRRVVARYVVRTEDIDDLTQETFLKCFAAEMKTEIRDPKAFLLRVARNTALTEVKRKSRIMTDYLEDSDVLEVCEDETQFSAERELDDRQKLSILAKSVASLPADSQQAFLMRKMEGLKYRQIALRLNLPLATVHRLIAKAIVHCSTAFREHGYDAADIGIVDIKKSNRSVAKVLPKSRLNIED